MKVSEGIAKDNNRGRQMNLLGEGVPGFGSHNCQDLGATRLVSDGRGI